MRDSHTKLDRHEMAAAVEQLLHRFMNTPIQGIMVGWSQMLWHHHQMRMIAHQCVEAFKGLPPGLQEEFAPLGEQLRAWAQQDTPTEDGFQLTDPLIAKLGRISMNAHHWTDGEFREDWCEHFMAEEGGDEGHPGTVAS